jgi:hypothetical protein
MIEAAVAKRGREHPGFVAPPGVQRIEEVVPDLSLVDDGPGSVPELPDIRQRPLSFNPPSLLTVPFEATAWSLGCRSGQQ